MAWLAVLGLMLGLTALFHALTRPTGGIVESTGEGGSAMIVLQRARNGHFLANGEVNGQAVTFLVDTGATDIALSEKFARGSGLEFGPRITVMTAAGPAPAWVTRLRQVKVGNLELNNVRATITPGLGAEALLGMSFLRHFSIRQEGDRLVIAASEQGS